MVLMTELNRVSANCDTNEHERAPTVHSQVLSIDEDVSESPRKLVGDVCRLSQLPQELLMIIIAELDCPDIYFLRGTSHNFHDLIHENENTIVRTWLAQSLAVFRDLIGPQEPSTKLNLRDRIDLRYRSRESQKLAHLLANHCCSKIHCTSASSVRVLSTWVDEKAHRLAERLMIGLFPLHKYLETFRWTVIKALHEISDSLPTDFVGVGFVLGLDQQLILDAIPATYLVSIKQSWRVLEGTLRAKGMSFGSRATHYPFTTVHAMLVLGGLDRLGEMIGKPNVPQRKADLDRYNAELWEGKEWRSFKPLSTAPIATISHIDPPTKPIGRASFPSCLSPVSVLAFVNSQEIIQSSLNAVILRRFGSGNVTPVDEFIKNVVSEDGDPDFQLNQWN